MVDADAQTLAGKLAAYFSGEAFRTPPDAILARMKVYVLDTLAVALAGSTARSSKIVCDTLAETSHGAVSVFGTGRSMPPGDAALVNGAAAHALELDDDERISVLHPGAVVVPAAFAVAEAFKAPGRDFLRGVLAGYEVAVRVGDVFKGQLFNHGFHPTAVCGVFGAAAAGATVLGLDRRKFTHALAIAGTQGSGLTEWRADGSWIKRLHPGRAAQSGVLAAMLAAKDFTGPATIFEGQSGYFTAFSHGKPIDSDAITRRLGEHFRATGTAVKPYPCCRFAHGAIDLAREASKPAKGRAIRKVVVRLYRTDVLIYHTRPHNAVDAQFNIPYLIAVALLRGAIGLRDFTDDAIRRSEILALAEKVQVIEDDEFSTAYPETYYTTLDVELSDGTHLESRSVCPSGDPEAPHYQKDPAAFPREAVEKTIALLQECGFGERSAPLIREVEAVDRAATVMAIAEILKAAPISAPRSP
jgi:2-methylcitrate dehydratase PrpD